MGHLTYHILRNNIKTIVGSYIALVQEHAVKQVGCKRELRRGNGWINDDYNKGRGRF